MTLINLNITAWNYTPVTKEIGCFTKTGYSTECILKSICPQLTDYYINVGIFIIVFWVASGWFLWWFMNYGYKKLPNRKIKGIGNLHERDTRLLWDIFIRDKVTKMAIIFITVVVYLNWR